MNEESCNLLTKIAEEARKNLKRLNIYQDEAGKRYNETHPNATQAQGGVDDPINAKGKGTGGELDTSNGGGYYDINGRPDVIGSGRNAAFRVNKYTPDKHYDCFIR